MTALLDVHVRRKRFGARDVLKDVHLQLVRGEVVSLVGASGCGKSTLLRLIAGLDRDFDGRIALDGQFLVGPTRDIRMVFQEPRLFPWLTVARNVAFDLGDGADQGAGRARVESLLEEVGLGGLGDRLPKELSGGQAQRVAIARGLFVKPRLLLLDEPFSAVDAFTRLKLQDLLLQVVDAHGVTVLLVTHDIAEAAHVGDRVIVLEADPGRLAADLRLPVPRPRERDGTAAVAAAARVRQALLAAQVL
jgi:sulfonate transport system ATP-binding protein